MGPKFEIFLVELGLGLGLGLGYVMVSEFTLVCVQVRTVILINDLAPGETRKVSLIHFVFLNFVSVNRYTHLIFMQNSNLSNILK